MTFKKPCGEFMSDFLEGAKKGIYMAFFTLGPALVMMYPVLLILESTGLMDLLSKILGPVMGLWGLPGEGAVVLISGMLNNAAGVAAIAEYFESGVFNGYQVATITPMAWMIFYYIQNIGRILNVVGTAKRYYVPIFIIAILTCMIVGWIGFGLVHILF